MKHRTASTLIAAAVATACLNAGCADAHHVDVTTVLADGNCETTETGVRVIDYAKLATLRGTHLIGMTESEESKQSPMHLVAIAPGEFRTAGYSITLQQPATLSVDLLTLQISIEHPPTDAILAQMITHPCLVVGVADPIVRRVRVLGDGAKVLGEIELQGK